MAFTRNLWEQIGGFPEHVLVGEDALYDMEARKRATPAFIANAKAFYAPQFTLRSAIYYMARYAIGDGQMRVRWARLIRNAERCVAQIAALVCLHWSLVPLLAILALEMWFAFHRDGAHLRRFGLGAILARFAFSLAVPWVVTANHIRGLIVTEQLSNPQNETANVKKRDALI